MRLFAIRFVAGLFVAALFALTPPVHAWLHAHRQFLLGVFVGSVAEWLVILGSRWAWDRWLWLRWFSWQ
jgi:hypothetical protein